MASILKWGLIILGVYLAWRALNGVIASIGAASSGASDQVPQEMGPWVYGPNGYVMGVYGSGVPWSAGNGLTWQNDPFYSSPYGRPRRGGAFGN